MASDESMTVRSCISSMQEEEFDHEVDDMEGGDYYQPHNYFSRLSVCTTTTSTHDDHVDQPPSNSKYEDYDHNDDMGMHHMMSGLSIESFDGDIEDVFSDGRLKRSSKGLDHQHNHMGLVITSDSDQESGGGCYSLPATPPRRRSGRNHRRRTCTGGDDKEYVSENKVAADHSRRRWRRKRMIMKERFARERDWKKLREEETMMTMEMENQTPESQRVEGVLGDDDNSNSKCNSTGGESQSESSSVPMLVITRPKGEKRSLRMDLEEVKACRELGFDLEMPSPLPSPSPSPLPLPLPLHTYVTNLSTDTASTATTSGGTSPVHWRISSPGDDPRDVKARLKVWAQAVALASTSRQTS